MAEVYIPQGPPPAPEEQEGRPSEPVHVDQPQFFARSGGTPLINSDHATIMGVARPQPPEEQPQQAPAPVNIGSHDASFVPAFQPVSNEQGGPGVIYGDGPTERRVNLPPPPLPVSTNLEVKFTPGPQPIANDPTAAIQQSQTQPLAPPVLPVPAQAQAPAPVSNEAAGAISAYQNGGVMNTSDTFIPQPPEQRGGGDQAPQSPLNVGGDDVQILPSGPSMHVSGDVSFGGGGDPTRQAGSEDVSFLGKGTINIGGTETFQAPSQQQDKAPNAEDHTFAKSKDHLSNTETYEGAKGDPTANLDHGLAKIGEWGTGRPKNVKG